MKKHLSGFIKCALFAIALISGKVQAQDVDLFVTDVTLPTVLHPQYSYGFFFNINNTGSNDAPESMTLFLLSPDSTSPTGEFIGSDFSSIERNSSIQLGGGIIVPNYSEGKYFIHVVVDHEKAISETNEDNNWLVIPVTIEKPYTDLYPVSLTMPDTIKNQSSSFLASLTEQNFGYVSVGAYTRTIYISKDTLIDSSDYKSDYQRSFYFPTNAVSPASFDLYFPYSEPGDYYIIYKSDHFNEVEETNEFNNIIYKKVTYAPVNDVDLVFTSGGLEGENVPLFVEGDVIPFKVTVSNLGTQPSTPSIAAVYFSTWDYSKTTATRLYEFAVPSIAGGTEIQISGNVTLPASIIPGDQYALVFEVDDLNTVTETAEFNNRIGFDIQIIAPDADLYLSKLRSCKPEGGNGEYFTVKVLVGNLGGGLVSNSVINYYLSSDRNLSSDDTLFLQQPIGSVFPGEYLYTTNLQIPNVLPGQYYLIASILGNNPNDVNPANDTVVLSKPVKIKAKKNGKREVEISDEEGFDFNSYGQSVTIAPNPASGFINVDLSKLSTKGPVVLSVLDSYGNVVKSEVVENSYYHQFPADDLSSGVYSVIIRSESYSEVVRVVVR